MPPKSSSGGRSRRSTRRSTPQTPSLPKSSSSEQSPAAEEPFSPPSSTSSAAAPIATTTSPLQSPSLTTTHQPRSASLPKDAALDTPTVSVEAPSDDAVLDPASSQNPQELGNPNPVSVAAGTEVVQEDHGKEQEQNATVVEASAKEVADGSGSGRKTKRMVKKTVKVVKKIVKRVPKRITKGVPDSTVDELGVPEANNDGTVLNSNYSTNSLSNSLDAGVKKEEDVKRCGSVLSSVENSGPDVSVSMEVEKLQQKEDICEQNFEKEQTLKVQGHIESASTEVDHNVDGVAGRNVKEEGKEVLIEGIDAAEEGERRTGELEVKDDPNGALDAAPYYDRNGEQRVDEVEDGGNVTKLEELEVKEDPSGALDAAPDCNRCGEQRADEVEDGGKPEEFEVKEDPSGALDAAPDRDRSGEQKADEVEDGGNVTKLRDEIGEGMYYSGEMEAVERRRRRLREIFVGGLDKDAKEEDIRKVFEEVGELLEVRLVMNGNTGKNKGYAFLCYASALDAKKALEKFSKVEICGKECGALPLEGKDTIYLGRIDKKWKDDDVAKLLQEMGIEGVDNVLVMKDPEKMEFNRGFAFVEFETCRDAQAAFKKLQKKDAFGKNSKIKAGWAEPVKEPNEAEMQKVKTVYAEFIPSCWDEEKVKENFEKFGEIDNVVLAKNLQNAKRKNYAFISYKSREDAIKCIESFNRQCHNDEGTKVNVKVSLARPMSRGKQPKQVLKPVSKEIPKERPKSSQGSVVLRQIDPRSMGGSTIHHYDIRRPELRQNIVHKEERSSTTSELVHLLREQASWRPPHAGPLNAGYPTTFSGRKRPVSALDTDPLYSNINGYPHHRVQTTLPSSSRLNASSSYGAFSQGGNPSSAYYPVQAGYAPGFPYGVARSYSGSELRDRAHGSSASNSALYRRY